MLLAVRFTTLGVKSLAFQIHLASRAVETLRVEVSVEGLNPFVSGLNREVTLAAHSLEHLAPVILAVRVTILEVELISSNGLFTLVAQEAVRVVLLVQSIHTLPNNGSLTLGTVRSKVKLIVLLTVQEPSLLNKADVYQLDTTARVCADKVIRAPTLTHGRHKRSSDRTSTGGTYGDPVGISILVDDGITNLTPDGANT